MQHLLANLPIPELSPDSMDFIAAHTQMRRLKSNSILLEQGKVCDSAYFVLEGGFVCRYVDPELDIGKTINFYLNDIHPFMACVDSYFTQTPSQCELRAISDAAVLQIRKKDLDILLQTDTRLYAFYQELVVTALREENDLKLKIIAYPSEQLYRYFMAHFPSVIQRVPSKYIAELMGISPEWLSKLKRPK
ncbi:MAG: Crp/Fnr family transcriptional regulator [Chitinophagales bacterium]|nr:Crp/Fnr family transcriptional regulator [Chitinophagales bacterium]